MSLEWGENKLPISVKFDDSYYSDEDGLAETQYVFLKGNDLKTRLCDGFHVAELGFGTGLNLFALWHLWRSMNAGGKIYFTSFEEFPLSEDEMRMAVSHWPELTELVALFFAGKEGDTFSYEDQRISVNVVIGDANIMLPKWSSFADAWFLDGFDPAKNPQMWSQKLMQSVANHTNNNGTFATYTSAGIVKRGLRDAGFKVERCVGFGRKRHMIKGQLLEREPSQH